MDLTVVSNCLIPMEINLRVGGWWTYLLRTYCVPDVMLGNTLCMLIHYSLQQLCEVVTFIVENTESWRD